MKPTRILPGQSAGRLAAACLVGAACHAAASSIHRWSFSEAAGAVTRGTEIVDPLSGAVAVVRGNGATFDGSRLILPGGTNGDRSAGFISAYLDLPNGLISSKTHLTVEIWATPLSARNWARVFDFGRVNGSGFGGGEPGEILDVLGTGQTPGTVSALDSLMLTFNRATDIGDQRMLARFDGADFPVDTSLATATGTEYHYALTFEDGAGEFGATGGRVSWYRNGEPAGSRDVPFRLADLRDVNNWLGRSNWTGDDNAHAAYNEFRIHDRALAPEEIVASHAAGPDILGELPDPPQPDHLWTFTRQAASELPAGAEFHETIGGETITLRGNGGSHDGGAVILPGTTTGNQPAAAISAYLDLPNGIVTASDSVTVEAWAAPLSSKNWQRLFDFGRCANAHGTGAEPGEVLDGETAPGSTAGYDYLSLTFNNGGDINSQQLEGQNDGAPPQFSFSTAATTPGTVYHYAFVVEDGAGEFGAAGCQMRWYRNGILQNSDDFPFRLADIEDVNNWIGRSMYSADSNSHMALDELRIYRRALPISEIAASRLAGPDPSVGPPAPPAPQPVPVHRWTFNSSPGGAPAGTEFLDESGAEAARLLGHGATLDGSALVLPGTTNGNQSAATISAYLDLRNGFISSRPSFTLEAWVTPLSSQNWQRVFDFGSANLTRGDGAAAGEILDGDSTPGTFQASDNLLLSLNNGGTLGSHRLETRLAGGSVVTLDTNLSGATQAGTEYHLALSVEDGAGAAGSAGCRVRWYRNGALAGSLDVPYRVADLNDVNNWIGRSNWSGDRNSHMALNELRVHDRPLQLAEIVTSFENGANAAFPPPVAVADAATIHPDQKVRLDVLANDSGSPLGATLEIASPPAVGEASVVDGEILYAHSGASEAPVTFTYRVANVGGATADGTVTIHFAGSLRLTNPALAMPDALPATGWQLVDALPGLTFEDPICIASIPGEPNRLFVCERLARIRHIPDVTATEPQANVFLDLNQVVAGRTPTEAVQGGQFGEDGLLGLAFHPDYWENGRFFVAYTVRIGGGAFHLRVSRFNVSASDPAVADPTSELILLQQLDEVQNHNGGDLHFGPDGYLYFATGDEGHQRDAQGNSQKIDLDFFSGIFRIDVDKRPGNLEPNPHPAIPTDAGIARFSVPADNPFVHTSLGGDWDGTFNGEPTEGLDSVRTEFWATGLRHAWRMAFDRVTGELWVGDVGQDTYEEVNRIVRGGNYGWVFRDGARDSTFTTPPRPEGFTSIDPFYEYPHTSVGGGDPNLKGNSVVGGYVYRGARYPSLLGRYVFSDSVSGHVWSMDTATAETVRLTGLPGAYGVLSAQGVDPSNGDLLFAAYNAGRILRLAPAEEIPGDFPTTLSATGLFADLSDLSPAPGLLPYEPNLSFWSDHAIKRRWFTIPDAGSQMTWNRDGNWTFPEGMLWVKHFDLELSRGDPSTKKRLETRVLVKTGTGSYGVSYRWNEEETEAYLVPDAGVEFDVPIDDHGTPHIQRWQIPGRASCVTCHTPAGGHALSFNTRQIHRNGEINGYHGNQIFLFSAYGFFENDTDPPHTLERHHRPEESDQPLGRRVRSYLAVNCAYCHQSGGSVAGFWDGRAELTLEQTGLIDGLAVNNGGDPLARYIVRGDLARSIVLQRVTATSGFGRMPPLATHEIDQGAIDLLTAWIHEELPGHELYADWQAARFSPGDPDGERGADPDDDGRTNYQEFVLGTPPLAPSSAYALQFAENGSLRFLRRAFRNYRIESSPDLATWSDWQSPGAPSVYATEDAWLEVPVDSLDDSLRFFRLRVSEP